MEKPRQILDDLYDSPLSESLRSLDEISIAYGKQDDNFSLESIAKEWRETRPRKVKMFIDPSKLKAKEAKKEVHNAKNAAEMDEDEDKQIRLIRNFSLDLEDNNTPYIKWRHALPGAISTKKKSKQFNTKISLSMVEVTQVLYIEGCKSKKVIPIRMIKELTDGTQSLNASYSHLGEKGAEALAIPLHLNSRITSLNLEDNHIGPDGCQYIAEVLLQNETVEDLNLSHNNIGLHGLICICRVLKTNLNISRLNLSVNGFGDTCTQFLAFLLQLTSLKELSLAANELEYHTAKAICDNLGKNETLEVLDISRNHFRLQGAVAIAKGVKDNTGLRKLDISHNGFGSEGVVAMATALTSNSTLQELDISNNRITDEVIPTLCTGLNANGSLLHLNIGENFLTMPSAMAFLTMINTSANSHLVSLDLKGVFIEHEFENLLKEIQKKKSFSVTHGILCYQNMIAPHKGASQS